MAMGSIEVSNFAARENTSESASAQSTMEPRDPAHSKAVNVSSSSRVSLHNQHYWNAGYYLGIGPGAHGLVPLPLMSVRIVPFGFDKQTQEKEKAMFLKI